MANYLFIYHGGRAPESESAARAVMQQWQDWLGALGDAVVDGGNPVGQSSTVLPDGKVQDNGGSNPASGYGIFSASSRDRALSMASNCPVLVAGGSVEVAEIVQL